MKLPPARNLPSSSWFVRVHTNGEIITIQQLMTSGSIPSILKQRYVLQRQEKLRGVLFSL